MLIKLLYKNASFNLELFKLQVKILNRKKLSFKILFKLKIKVQMQNVFFVCIKNH